MSGAVKVLDVNHEPLPLERRERIAAAVLAAIFVIAVSLFFVASGVTRDGSAAAAGQPTETIRPMAVPLASSLGGAIEEFAVAEAVDTFERFARLINLGDTRNALALMSVDPPMWEGFRTAEWPLLPTSPEWWGDDTLDADQVRGVIRYLSTIPGWIDVTDCEGTSADERNLHIVVTCSFETTSAPLQAIGQKPERGQLQASIFSGLIAGVERNGTIDAAVWDELSRWSAQHDPNRHVASIGPLNPTRELQPIYSGNSALDHLGLAADMAAQLDIGEPVVDTTRFTTVWKT